MGPRYRRDIVIGRPVQHHPASGVQRNRRRHPRPARISSSWMMDPRCDLQNRADGAVSDSGASALANPTRPPFVILVSLRMQVVCLLERASLSPAAGDCREIDHVDGGATRSRDNKPDSCFSIHTCSALTVIPWPAHVKPYALSSRLLTPAVLHC